MLGYINVCFAFHNCAVFERSVEATVLERHWEDTTPDTQQARSLFNGLFIRSRDLPERGDKEIAKGVTSNGTAHKPVLEQLFHELGRL